MAYYKKQHPKANNKDLLNTCLEDGINRYDQASADFSLAALQSRYWKAMNCRQVYDWYHANGGPAAS
ncbi:hypothetical protein [Massilia sp. DWR3-1-1]|uniref:hypothetical protein n=1 Tax=Massilia sp. DWR3-1-1 TaxID=2804559 RepID=UPI003CF0A6F8